MRLKKEDQGVSFFEFLRFIQLPDQQARLQSIIQLLLRIQELADQTDGLEIVLCMVTVLLAEAEKVVQTTRRLSSTLLVAPRFASSTRAAPTGGATGADSGIDG